MGVHNLADKDAFKDAVIDRVDVADDAKGRLVMVDFFATWCGPCKVIAPQIAEWADGDFNGKVDFYKVDVDEVSEVAGEYDVRAMPTFLLFRDGKPIADGKIVGANPKALLDALNRNVETN